ncbi:MAG: YitT family protein [Bacilli bacterium]
MYKWKLFKKNIRYFFLDHKVSRFALTNMMTLFMCVLSSLCFAIGFRSFISLADSSNALIVHLATGGISGIAQCIVKVVHICGVNNIDYNTLQSILYFLLNLPLLIFSFIKIGWKFSIFTSLNVIFVSVFIQVLPGSFFDPLGALIANDTLARAMFAGLLTGLACACAFISNHSAGGVDIIAYYYSLKKSVNTGKYMAAMNACIILTFTVISFFEAPAVAGAGTDYAKAIVTACYSVAYLFVSSLVIDMINVRNKKMMLQIVTSNENLKHIIAANVPHSSTVVKATGGFSGAPNFIIYATVSNREAPDLIKKIREVDPTTFINATSLRQVYGKFYIKPVE